jgi:hypothetical protein
MPNEKRPERPNFLAIGEAECTNSGQARTKGDEMP